MIEPGGDPDDESCAFRAIPKDSKEYRKLRDQEDTDFLGMNIGCNGSIIIVPDYWAEGDPWCKGRDQECARSILMHEIGHEWGLQHLKDPGAVMQWETPPKSQDYNESDREECIRVMTCKRKSSPESEEDGR